MSTARPWLAWYPADILNDPKYICLDRSAKLTYRELLDRAWIAGAKLPANERKLAALAGMPLDEFRRDWEQIQDQDDPCFITHPVFDGFLTNKRLIAEWRKAEEIAEIARVNGQKGGRPPKQDTGLNIDNTNKKTHPVNPGLAKRNPDESYSQSQSQSQIQEERFKTYWSAYPKKTGKGAAKKAWAKINPSAALLQKILTALEWQTKSEQWTKDRGQFIPNPATYLNQERWEDEPPAIPNPSPLSEKGQRTAANMQAWLEENDAK